MSDLANERRQEHDFFNKRAAECIEAANAAHADDVSLYDDYDLRFLENIPEELALCDDLSPRQRSRLAKLYAVACDSKY